MALRRWAADGWLLLQGTAAATAAWLIAKYLLDHPQPFFAPVAALVALNAALGERGRNAVRLLQGVIVGIATGELTLLLLGGSTGSLALATFTAMAVAHAMRGTRIVIAQAAVGAILTIAVGDHAAGLDRLIDALVGAGVALVFSQVLFSPEPVALVRRAEAAALADLARALESTAAALERDDEASAERAINTLRDLRDRLAELARTREAGPRAARRSALWRSQVGPVVRESEHAGHLDLLHASCLMLTRTAILTSPDWRRRLAGAVRELAEALARLAADPGDRATRQAAVEGALDAVRPLAGTDPPSEFETGAALAALQAVALDVMVFAGVDPAEARAAVKAGTGRFDVPTPPPTTRRPFGPSRAGPR